jgi:serine/threonine protein kinase
VVKLLDFGMSKLADSTSHLTHSLTYLGTPYYMAPEQARGDAVHVDARCDVFALGVMAFEMLAGRRPFAGTSVEAVLYQIVHEPLPSLASFDMSLPPDLDVVLRRATAKKREERHASAGELVAEIEPLLGGAAGPRPPARATRRWPQVLIGAFVLGALVAAVPLGLRRLRPPPSQPAMPTIEIRLDVTPAHAVAVWDGRRLAEQTVRLPADRSTHRLTVSAPGFQPIERTITADQSASIVVMLAPAAPPLKAAAPPARATGRPPDKGTKRPAGPSGPAAPPIIEDPNGL